MKVLNIIFKHRFNFFDIFSISFITTMLGNSDSLGIFIAVCVFGVILGAISDIAELNFGT